MVGALTRELRGLPRSAARATLVSRHGLDERAADNLLAYLRDQAEATEVVPDDRQLVIERIRDELGDWRVCVLTPLGGRVHAPWAMAVTAKIRAQLGLEVETMWTDDGLRGPLPRDRRAARRRRWCCPSPTSWSRWCCASWAAAPCSPAKFREAAARALLLPRRFPGPARAAVADAQEGRRPAGRRRPPAVVPHPAGGLPGVPARRVRPAGAGRGAAGDRPGRDGGEGASARRRPRRSPRGCCSATSPTTSMTATPRWPSGGPRR